jgi:metal-responsive CopG/Arc/MetJ family transcriptional regulator
MSSTKFIRRGKGQMNVRVNITIPEHVAGKLFSLVPKGQRSKLVAELLEKELKTIERERLEQELAEGYSERREEDMGLSEEWRPTIS